MRPFAMVLCSLPLAAVAQLTPPRMASQPDIAGDRVVLVAEGDLWIGSITGKRAERLTSSPGVEASPRFSPDGKTVAFVSEIDGRRDAYTIPIEGGQPKRITFDPAGVRSLEWDPKADALWVISSRESPFGILRLWRAPLDGSQPTRVPIERAGYANPSPQGILFTRQLPNSNAWSRYQGGQANDVYLFEPTSKSAKRLARTTYSEETPVWCGGSVFCTTELEGRSNVYEVGGRLRRVTEHNYPVRDLATDGQRLIYSSGGELFTFEPRQGKSVPVTLALTSDRIHSQPYRSRARAEEAAIGPTGKRLLLTARGQLWSAPATKGDLRPILTEPGIRVQQPAWAPNGQVMSWVSDVNDEWNIWVQPANLGAPAAQLTQLKGVEIVSYQWAPDSLWLAVLDASGKLWRVPFGGGQPTVLAHEGVAGINSFAISPTSQHVVYSYNESFYSESIKLIELATGKVHRMAGRPFKSRSPVFDRNGRWLYFLSDRSVQLSWDNFDFQLNASDATQIFALRLAANTPNPLRENVDEEGVAEQPLDPQIQYRFDLAEQKILALPVPAGSLSSLRAVSQRLFWLQGGELKSLTMSNPKVSTIAEGVSSFQISADAKQMLIRQGDTWTVTEVGSAPGRESVPLSSLTVTVDPVKEWRQILRESWRHMRDNFYDPKLHGANWPAVWEEAAAQLPRIGHRTELTGVIAQMQAELNVSHMFAGGGTQRFAAPTSQGARGYLRADLEWPTATGPAKIVHILAGDGFEMDERSPLLDPSIDSDLRWLKSINGVELKPTTNIDRLLDGLGGQFVRLSLAAQPAGPWREEWVRLPSSESSARYYDWVGRSRQAVETQSKERVAYLHVPDMGEYGMQEFTKHFYANLDKSAMIIDVRANGGGITNGMILERLRRVLFEYDQGRYGDPVPYHRMGFLPHVVVLCDEDTASDGEYFCTGFRMMGLGTSIGTRTWGGYVAVGGFTAVDGGFVSCPVQGSFTPKGEWLPDGTGFKPDIEVELALVEDGSGDAQLQRAIQVALQKVAKEPRGLSGRKTPPIKTR